MFDYPDSVLIEPSQADSADITITYIISGGGDLNNYEIVDRAISQLTKHRNFIAKGRSNRFQIWLPRV